MNIRPLSLTAAVIAVVVGMAAGGGLRTVFAQLPIAQPDPEARDVTVRASSTTQSSIPQTSIPPTVIRPNRPAPGRFPSDAAVEGPLPAILPGGTLTDPRRGNGVSEPSGTLAPTTRGYGGPERRESALEMPAVGERSGTIRSVTTRLDTERPDTVVVVAHLAQAWIEGNTTVRLIRGPLIVRQGERSWEARELVSWEQQTDQGWLIECYLEGDVAARGDGLLATNQNAFVRLGSSTPIRLKGTTDTIERSAADDPIVRRAARRRANEQAAEVSAQSGSTIQQIQYLQGPNAGSGVIPFPPAGGQPYGAPSVVPPPIAPPAENSQPALVAPSMPPSLIPPSLTPGQFSNDNLFPASFADRVSITPRNFEVPFVFKSKPVPGTMPPEQIMTITRGVNIVIERTLEGDVLDLTADSAVVWTDALSAGDGTNFSLGPETPFQVYLHGNIVVRQGTTVARANEAYFDRREGRGLLRDAEVRTFVPSLRGDLRVRSQVVRFNLLADQLASLGGSDIEVFANNAWVTASRFGKPTYRLQAGTLALEQRPAGQVFDAATGQTKTMTQPWLTSQNNQFLFGEIPIAGSPYLSSPANEFSIPIQRFTVGYDRTFGVQALSRWDVADLFGLSLPSGTDWTMDLDYLSERGPRVGSDWSYQKNHDLFGYRAHTFGEGFATFVYDEGRDNLGEGRNALIPENNARGAIVGRTRTDLPYGLQLDAELGYISDYNFYEQYEEQRWDAGKDAETLIQLRQQFDNSSWSIMGRPQVNEFVNQTEWLPRFDVTTLGQPLFVLDSLNSSVNWSQHSMVGYGQLNPSTPPVNAGQPFTPLPYVADVDGVVAMTRHELTSPFNLGPVKVVPYALGELAYWGEGLDGNDLSRAYGSAGLRGSMMMTKIMPYIRSDVWGLNGLAHKMIFDFDYSISESTTNLGEIAQYNEFDDNAQERFRERFVTQAFGGALPATADPRGYALRAGAGRSVTSPYHELVDDQNVLRLGWRNRWQTRSGTGSYRRVRDWMTLDLEASFFPGADTNTAEDNFGDTAGLLSANYAWNVGERTSLLADAIYDMFDLGQHSWSVGVLSHRLGRGSFYIGYREIGLGPLDSKILSFNASYAMSPKWLGYYGFAYDFAESRGQGHSIGLAKIGRDFIWRLGADVDESKNDVGISLSIEPFIGARDADDLDKLLNARSRLNARGSQLR